MTGCDRMPLYEIERNANLELDLQLDLDLELDLDVEVDVDIQRQIEMPELMKVGFYSTDGLELRNTQYVSADGGPITTPPGTYRMVIYSFGNEYTQVRGEGSVNTLEAFTSDITDSKKYALAKLVRAATRDDDADGAYMPEGPIIFSPDHFLVTVDEVTIPEFTQESQTITIRSSASTICQTYSFEARSVIGAEFVESCEAFVTNQARSSFFGRGEVSSEPATLWFPVGVDRKRGCLYTTFNTFGKLPGDSRAFIHFLIHDTQGGEHYFSADITGQFERPDNRIVIEERVEVPEPDYAKGGIAPTVDEWHEESHNVDIG